MTSFTVRFHHVLAMGACTALLACSEGGKSHSESESVTALRCNEVMYNAGDSDSLEWVEFQIQSGPSVSSMTAVELRLEGAVEYTFPEGSLDSGERVVVTNDTNAFRARYAYADYPVRLFGPFIGRLNNAGEVIEIKIKGPGDASCRYESNPPWPALAAGKGHSLVYIDGNPSYPESYGASLRAGGNPGGPDTTLPGIRVRINEIKPGGSDGWIELYNPEDMEVDLSFWLLSKSADGTEKSYTLPAGTRIAAGGYLVLREETERQWGDFFPSQEGDQIYLVQIVDGKATGISTGITYPALEEGGSAGVVQLNTGEIMRGPLASLTEGGANSGLIQGPLYISEIYYNPAEGGAEFLELTNRTDEDIVLYEPAGWKVEGIAFSFPAGAVLPANGKILLVRSAGVEGADTATFRSVNKVAASVPVYNYTGKLSNRGEQIAILKPLRSISSGWSYTWYDLALYEDRGDWPTEADGDGKSLVRVHPDLPGSDPSAWKAASPTPGR